MSAEIRNGNDDVEKNKSGGKVNLDTVLVGEIGQFGKFQMGMLLLNVVAVIFTSWSTSEFVFTTARINTRCLIPECDEATPEFSPPWVTNAIPSSSGGLDSCQRYANASFAAPPDSCPAELFNRTQLMTCQDYVYENTDTVVYDFDLACKEWTRTFIGTFRSFATFVSLPLTGYISDRWGRRVALTVNAINTAWAGSLRYFANSYITFTIFEFLETAVGGGVFSSAFILLMEITGPKYRVAAGCTMHAAFSTGQILMGLIAWGVPNWRWFTVTLHMPMYICIAYIWLMSESVRWLMAKGKFEELGKLLKKIAKTNGKTLSPASLEALKRNIEEENKTKELEKSQNHNSPWLIALVFQHKSMMLRCVVVPVWWITTMLIFFGLSINAVNVSGNKFVNYMAVAAADIPGNIVSIYAMGKIGRKPVLIISLWLCAACMIAYVFLPKDYNSLSLIFYLLGKSSIASVGAAVYVYTAELFPTKYRHTLFAYSSMMGKVGSITAPLTPALGVTIFEKFPFVLFGSCAFVSGLLSFVMPETLGASLPDTIEEAANLGKTPDLPNKQS